MGVTGVDWGERGVELAAVIDMAAIAALVKEPVRPPLLLLFDIKGRSKDEWLCWEWLYEYARGCNSAADDVDNEVRVGEPNDRLPLLWRLEDP